MCIYIYNCRKEGVFEISFSEHFIFGFNDLSKMNDAGHTPEVENIKKLVLLCCRVVAYVNTFFSRATNIPTVASTRFNVSNYALKKSSVNDWVLLTNDFLLISQAEFTYVQFVEV